MESDVIGHPEHMLGYQEIASKSLRGRRITEYYFVEFLLIRASSGELSWGDGLRFE
jgi:hypothetical protein